MQVHQRFNEWVKKAKEEGQTIEEIAVALGISVSRLHQLRHVTGKNPGLELAFKIQKVTKIPAKDWLS